jgi:hypothetical protein
MVLCLTHIHSKRYQLHSSIPSNNSFQFPCFWRDCLRDTLFGDGCKVGRSDSFGQLQVHSITFCFTTQDHVLFTLWKCQIINGFKGRHGKIWYMTMRLVRLVGITLPMSSSIVSLGFLQGLNLACLVMILGSRKNPLSNSFMHVLKVFAFSYTLRRRILCPTLSSMYSSFLHSLTP